MIKRSRNIFLVTTILAGTAYAMPAVAQETGGAVASQTTGQTAGAQPDQTAAASTDIVVTGSRIARPDLQASVPVVTIGAERIQDTGASNIQDVLATLPAVGQNVSRTSSNFSNTGNGVATVNLRNLGASRTLVLIDGRRSLGIAGSSAVDVNNIPTDLIERVEVVTGGASAVYGSEAVAGVVNFVLNRKFEGLRVRAQNTISDKGDAPRQYVSITAGHGFADDRGHVAANFSYDNDHGLPSRNRSFSAKDVPNRSSYAAQGLFDVSNPATQTTFSPATGRTFTFDGNNALKGYQGANIDGYNRNGDRLLSVPVERLQGTFLGNYDFSDAFKVYAEGEYVHTNSNASLEPSAIANSGPGAALNFDGSAYAGIPITSPYVPAAVRAAAIANGTNVIQFRRRSNDIFSRSNQNDRDFYRGVLGVKGDIGGSGKWSYDLYYEHSQSRDHTTAQAIYTPNYGAALSNEIGPDGQVRCSNAAARAAGCVPINIFGYNTASAAASRFLQTYTGPTTNVTLVDGNVVQLKNGSNVTFDYLAKVNQDVVSGSISGNLFSLWGGPVAVAFGGEYRHEKSSEVFDPFTQAGLSSGNQITNTQGQFNVKEGFVEVVAPIVEDRPGLHYLGIEGAARYADYSTIGGVWSFKAGATYAPTADIRFRGVFARATRAPNIGELFASLSQTFPAVNDPCDQAQGNGDGAKTVPLPAGCSAIPGIAATVASRGSFQYSTSQIQTIDGLLGGNRNLKQETADTITAGAVITPTMIRNFSLTVDYYRIKVKNAIGIIGQQVSVSQCFTGGQPLFCNNVIRDANGFITRVNALNLNTGSYLVSGLDVEGRYSIPLGGTRLDIDVLYNHRFDQQQTPFPGGPVQNELGQANCYSCGRLGSGFKDRVTGNFTLGTERYQLNYRVDYLGPLKDNLDGSTTVITPIPAYWYHNVQGKIAVGEGRKMELYVGVNNLFDKKPPMFGDTNPVTWPGTQTVADTYDLYGRMFYAGATIKF
ncbi:MAG: TonB-dependent receptor [Sphingomonas sp.]|uniref:TonB-dependent receptor domain-containing protein n=1 Tax=Sphingomonas TaxID=13687 RepID=UPI00039981C3|nr:MULTISPECIES: TonB-dependent receptor [Sphingomonas]MCM2298931.1 TonB-dependent receptor [Sphingomonas sp.]